MGVRIPKPLLEQSQLAGEVEMQAKFGEIVIRRARKTRDYCADDDERNELKAKQLRSYRVVS